MQEKLQADASRDGWATETNHLFHFDFMINFSDGKAVSMNFLKSDVRHFVHDMQLWDILHV